MNKGLNQKPDLSAMTLLWLVALLSRLALLALFPFDGLYGQDAYAYYDFARQLQHLAPGTFYWPWGYPLVLAGGLTLFGAQPEAGQLLNVLMGAALAPLTYALARQVGCGLSGALVSGLLMAVCGQALQSSLVLMSDIPALCWALLSAVLLRRYQQTGRARWLWLAAFLLAFASVTRWLYLILALPWLGTLLTTRPSRWRHIAAAGVIGGVVLAAQIIISRSSGAPALQHYDIDQWNLQHASERSFDNPDGHFEYVATNAAFYAAPFYETYYLAPVFIPFVLIGAASVIRRRDIGILLIGWAALPYLFLIGIPFQNIRFPLIVFPAVAVLAGVGTDTLSHRLKNTPPQWRMAAAYAGVLVTGLGLTLRASHEVIGPFIARQQQDKITAQWAQQHIPAGRAVYAFGLTLTLRHYTELDVIELYYETPKSLAARWIPGQADYLLLNTWSVENQWAGLPPQIAYHWLRDRRGLAPIGRLNNYRLFRVNG